MERDSIVRWIRREELGCEEGVFTLPQSLVDRWLRERFPGRTSEELDGIDILREMRLMETQHLFSINELIKANQRGDVKGSDIDEQSAIDILSFEETVEELRDANGE